MVCGRHAVDNRECRNCCDNYQRERVEKQLEPGPFGIFCDHCNRKSSCRICFNRYQDERAIKIPPLPPAPFGIFCKHGVNYQTKTKCSDPECNRTSQTPRPQSTSQSRPTPRPTPRPRSTTFKRVEKKCIHGTRLDRCSICGGSELCIHGIQKYKCKPCNGRGNCIHGRQKYFCKECMGKGVCANEEHKSSDGSVKLKRECKKCIAEDIAKKAAADSYAAAVQVPGGAAAAYAAYDEFPDLGAFKVDDDDGWLTDDYDDGVGYDSVTDDDGFLGGEKRSRKLYKRSNKKIKKTIKSKPYRKTHKKLKRKSKRSSRLTVKR